MVASATFDPRRPKAMPLEKNRRWHSTTGEYIINILLGNPIPVLSFS